MKVVRLLTAYRLWNAGEIAGFPEDEAALMIEQGIAADPEAPAVEDEGAEGEKPAEGKRKK